MDERNHLLDVMATREELYAFERWTVDLLGKGKLGDIVAIRLRIAASRILNDLEEREAK